MGAAGYNVRHIAISIDDEITRIWVAVDATGDAPLGVQGWHHKAFPPSAGAACDILAKADFILWPQEAPPMWNAVPTA